MREKIEECHHSRRRQVAEHAPGQCDFGLFRNQPHFTALHCQPEELNKLNSAEKETAL